MKSITKAIASFQILTLFLLLLPGTTSASGTSSMGDQYTLSSEDPIVTFFSNRLDQSESVKLLKPFVTPELIEFSLEHKAPGTRSYETVFETISVRNIYLITSFTHAP